MRARSLAVSDAGITGVKGELPWAERGGDASHSVALLAAYSFMWFLTFVSHFQWLIHRPGDVCKVLKSSRA